VLLIRASGGEPALDFSAQDGALRVSVEHATLGLGRPKANHSAGHVLAGDIGPIINRLHSLRIVQRRDRVSQCTYGDVVTFSHRDPQLLT